LKNYPELEKEEILMQINKLEPSRIHDVIEGKFYRRNFVTVFGEVILKIKM
jgi:methionine synthase II (cobalamin-independent)